MGENYELQQYQERVLLEKQQLDYKRQRLCEFKTTALFAGLSLQEQELLNTQGHLMTAYSAVLGERIAGFEKDHE